MASACLQVMGGSTARGLERSGVAFEPVEAFKRSRVLLMSLMQIAVGDGGGGFVMARQVGLT